MQQRRNDQFVDDVRHDIRPRSVDENVLELRPGCLEPYVAGPARNALVFRYRHTIDEMKTYLLSYLPEGGPLVSVAAHYAALTLRHGFARQGITLAYPLFLLSGWLWDDLADTNKGDSTAARVSADALPRLEWAITKGEFTPITRDAGRFRSSTNAAIALAAAAHREWTTEAHEYGERIEAESIRFLRSFARKTRMTHFGRRRQGSYSAVRAVCVGMQPCYELSYAHKASIADVPVREHLDYLAAPQVRACSRAATLHCAAINDLFSMYKDRCVEDTANFPAVLADGNSLDLYFEGAVKTVSFVRKAYANYVARRAELPAGASRSVVEETWEDMMEGNVFYHLLVPRYQEGITLLHGLLDPNLGQHERYAHFSSVFENGLKRPLYRSLGSGSK